MQSTHIVNEGTYGVLEVFGPTLELSILPEEAEGAYCTMTGTIPPGVSVPLHSHPDIESFFWCREPSRQCLSEMGGSNGWM
jgi:hypothetical protein